MAAKARNIIETATVVIDDETTPLLDNSVVKDRRDGHHQDVESQSLDNGDQEQKKDQVSLLPTLIVLMIGVFISQADTSLVLATYGVIASEFHDLESGSWLLSSYMLAMCVAQPIYGKLSDIYGRKRCLQCSYILFALGTASCGLGTTLGQVVAARAVQGAGGAGMVCMVSILLTDLVPLQDVAAYRSYVNVIQTVGRSCGGAIGGLLAQTIGWRWAFLIQFPPTVIAILLVEWKLRIPQKPEAPSGEGRSKLNRIDFAGIVLLSLAILCAISVLDLGGQKYAFGSSLILTMIGVAFVSAVAFAFVERYLANEPVFPLHLLRRWVVVTSYSILTLQNLAQTAIMFIIPIYFQITQRVSPAAAGAYLIPAIVGNAVGGLATGWSIRRTGRYKLPMVMAGLCSAVTFTLALLLWHGQSSPWQSLVVFPGGAATGIAHSAVFIALTSGVAENEIAIAGSGLYLSGNVGGVAGISAASAVFQLALRGGLTKALKDTADGAEIATKALSNLEFVLEAGDGLRRKLLPAYVTATHHVFVLGLICSAVSFLFALSAREKRLEL